MATETLRGTVTLLRRQGGQPPRIEFELRLDGGEKRLVSSHEDPTHSVVANQQIVVTGTVDTEGVLRAESIAPVVVPVKPQPPPAPQRSIAGWLLLPPIATAMVLITTMTIQSGMLAPGVWFIVAALAIAFALFRAKRPSVRLVLSGAAIATALTAYNVTPDVALGDLTNTLGVWLIVFVLLILLWCVSAIIAVLRLIAHFAARKLSTPSTTPPAPPLN